MNLKLKSKKSSLSTKIGWLTRSFDILMTSYAVWGKGTELMLLINKANVTNTKMDHMRLQLQPISYVAGQLSSDLAPLYHLQCASWVSGFPSQKLEP